MSSAAIGKIILQQGVHQPWSGSQKSEQWIGRRFSEELRVPKLYVDVPRDGIVQSAIGRVPGAHPRHH